MCLDTSPFDTPNCSAASPIVIANCIGWTWLLNGVNTAPITGVSKPGSISFGLDIYFKLKPLDINFFVFSI